MKKLSAITIAILIVMAGTARLLAHQSTEKPQDPKAEAKAPATVAGK